MRERKQALPTVLSIGLADWQAFRTFHTRAFRTFSNSMHVHRGRALDPEKVLRFWDASGHRTITLVFDRKLTSMRNNPGNPFLFKAIHVWST